MRRLINAPINIRVIKKYTCDNAPVDPENPYELTEGEMAVMKALEASVMRSTSLQEQIRFIIDHGAMYQVTNNNLFFHGCIPMDKNGDFQQVQCCAVII